MKWNKEEKYFSFNNENIIISYWCDWIQWFPSNQIKYNWKNVTFIALRYEDDIITGGREIELGLLGFNLRIRWTHETPEGDEFNKKTHNALDDILNKSFYGWSHINAIKDFKNKEMVELHIFRTRKIARAMSCSSKVKKLFIQ